MHIAGRHGQGQAAHLMAAAVQAHTTGEQAIAVGNLADIFSGTACSGDGAGTAVFPQVNVLLGVERYHATAGSTGGGVDTRTVFQRC